MNIYKPASLLYAVREAISINYAHLTYKQYDDDYAVSFRICRQIRYRLPRDTTYKLMSREHGREST